MENPILSLHPRRIWNYFYEICQIPRPSKKEQKIIDYLVTFGKKFNLETHVDELGNVLIRKNATPGKENLKTVILQNHMDMVCEKNSGTVHDFDKDPIIPKIEGQWVKATGTTLGADNGIGIAAALAILEAKEFIHGPLECLFTVDEETGLTGAFGLKEDFLKGKILLNLDSEDEGEIFIGCAGGKDSVIKLPVSREPLPADFSAFKIEVSGLQGGHSGDDIHKGRGNSNKILNRLLWNLEQIMDIRISHFEGGNLRNAIAREAFAEIAVPASHAGELMQKANPCINEMKAELQHTDNGLSITITPSEKPQKVLSRNSQSQLLWSLYACPHGVIAMSPVIAGLVETSTNLASVRMKEDHILITTSQRSSIESAKHDIANMVANTFRLAGATVEHGDGYPGWTPNPNSEILEISRKAYLKLFSTEPQVKAIHAGLECGLIGEKYPGMDMVSFGPTIKGAHSPDERIEIITVQKFWDLLLEVLRKAPVNS
ncbi:MAG: aminoacyl-histidine dipeptidase [Bacteroidales bacterium]